jgi:hypothetical protein
MMSRKRTRKTNGRSIRDTIAMFGLMSGSLLFTFGCGNPKTSPALEDDTVLMPPSEDVHAHASEGPHHGALIELGAEEYHAEFVHSDTSLTFYVLDSSATKAVPIDAPSVVLNLVVDGQAEQVRLVANPEPNDPAGKSSRFHIESSDTATAIDQEGTVAKLSLTIGDTAYVGEVQHDHAGHLH